MITTFVGPEGRHRLRAAMAGALYRTGLLQAWARLMLRRRAVVLTYHRVLTPPAERATWSSPGMIVRSQTFARHLQVLRDVFHPLSLDDFARHLETGRPFAGPACLVTFDDGWCDTLEEALPLLEAHRIPAVVFIPVDCVGSPDGFWQERLAVRLHQVWTIRERGEREPGAVSRLLDEAGLSGVLALPAAGLRNGIREAIAHIKAGGGLRARVLLERIERELPALPLETPAPDRLVDWPGLGRLLQRGVTLGGHGATHRILTEIDISEASAEARRCYEVLARVVGGPVLAYSYPNGNWTAAIATATKSAGFRLAFTTRRGSVSATDEPMSLPRVNVHEGATDTPGLFLARAMGLF